ncbi:sulfatase [Lentisphaera profundi]|uniref:Sulfatase n=1 Tax=Lentisphaera profundi TaxID=1658616 RepID=A0ABY7VV04_9BACT|nr:sulfatase [Lentisphaera profundi]WDE97118.1 sulfatase [Lentisphaera profundi]
MKYLIMMIHLIGMVTLQSKDQVQPNIVFILLDDFGVKDLGCYGSAFHESPHIDQLAKEGVRFTNSYAAHSVCGPSRTAIISGRSAPRLGLAGIGGNIQKVDLPWPKVLQNKGYKNCFAGKWHMGGDDSVLPAGFDVNISGCNVGQVSDYYYPYKRFDDKPYGQDVQGMEDGKEGDFLTDKITDKVLDFIDENHKNPFLVYFSFYQTHKSYDKKDVDGKERISQGKLEDTEYFERKLANNLSIPRNKTRELHHGKSKAIEALTQSNAGFAAQIKVVDDNLGRLFKKLKDLNLEENTIVIFTSDQGSLCSNKRAISTQAPYRLGKGWHFEGGLRVPLIMKWPTKIKAGTINKTPTISMDLYPTILDMLNIPQQEEQSLDGVNIWPALQRGKTISFDRTWRWAFASNHSSGHRKSAAIRQGDYKLIYWYEDKHTELYNVVNDIGENHNIIIKHPELAASLKKELLAPDYMKTYRK